MRNNLLVIISLLFISYANGQQVQKSNKLEISEIQKDLIFEKTKVLPEDTQLSIAIIKNGNVAFYGIERIDDTIKYADNSKSLFEIGSITKVFTSTILANLVLEGEINLKDPIQKYIDYPIANDEITVLQLANHTSGLPKLPSNLNLEEVDQSNPYKDYNVRKLREYLMNSLETNTKPGEKYQYSNVGAGILGYVLELKSNKSYEELIQHYIFSEYDMRHSTTSRNKIDLEMVDGLDSSGNKTANWDLNSLIAAGGMISNVEDLSKFALAHFDDTNKELKLTRESTFEIPQNQMETGLAWKILNPIPNLNIYAHNGGTGGYSSLITIDPITKNGVILLSNVSAFNNNSRNMDQLCFQLLKTLYR